MTKPNSTVSAPNPCMYTTWSMQLRATSRNSCIALTVALPIAELTYVWRTPFYMCGWRQRHNLSSGWIAQQFVIKSFSKSVTFYGWENGKVCRQDIFSGGGFWQMGAANHNVQCWPPKCCRFNLQHKTSLLTSTYDLYFFCCRKISFFAFECFSENNTKIYFLKQTLEFVIFGISLKVCPQFMTAK